MEKHTMAFGMLQRMCAQLANNKDIEVDVYPEDQIRVINNVTFEIDLIKKNNSGKAFFPPSQLQIAHRRGLRQADDHDEGSLRPPDVHHRPAGIHLLLPSRIDGGAAGGPGAAPAVHGHGVHPAGRREAGGDFSLIPSP